MELNKCEGANSYQDHAINTFCINQSSKILQHCITVCYNVL